MARRRTSIIGARVPPGSAAPPPATDELRSWALAAVRELVLSPSGDPQEEQRSLAAVRAEWHLALGRAVAAPAHGSGRSTVTKQRPDADGRSFWCKSFDARNIRWQANERAALMRLLDVDAQLDLGLRQHVGWLRTLDAKHTRIQEVITFDAGPDLAMWQRFAPCSGVGPDLLPLPLFAQPLFLAALARQTLVALDAVAQAGVVNTDLKAENLCLALPQRADWTVVRGQVKGCWNLRQLPLRSIDFEVGIVPGIDRQIHGADNDNMSPYLRECHRLAAQESHPADQQEVLAGIDWGADLWSLGWMLHEWTAQAQEFMKAYQQAFGLHWGAGSTAEDAAGRAIAPLLSQLHPLRQFATRLQAQDRPLADAGKRRLDPRLNRPHSSLWNELEGLFPQLGPGWRDGKLVFSFINPDAPLAEASLPGPLARAAQGARQAAVGMSAALRRSAHSATATLTRRPGRAVAASLMLALPALAWTWRAEARQGGLGACAAVARSQTQAYLADGQAHQRWLASQALALADRLQPGQAQALGLQPLADTPPPAAAKKAGSPEATKLALQAARDKSLRGLMQLALLPTPVLTSPAARGTATRLLQAVYSLGGQLEPPQQDAVPIAAPVEAVVAALARIHAELASPLAAMLQVHLHGCYTPAPAGPDIDSALADLLALPRDTDNAAEYASFARAMQARLRAGQRPCLL